MTYDRSRFYGMDPDEAEHGSRRMNEGASQVRGMVDQISALLGEVVWEGADSSASSATGTAACARSSTGRWPTCRRTPTSSARRAQTAAAGEQLMAGFQGADVDGLDRTAQTMLDASEAATAVATALQAIVVALEAMSWTGFAAALAAYLKGVVIPWVKATAAALKAFGQILQLASSSQRETSGDRPVVSTGGGSYQTPQLPTVSAADGPRIATIEIHITNGQTGQGSGVQVTAPTLPGQVTAHPDPVRQGRGR